MEFDERIIAGAEQEADGWQYSLRPRLLNEYIGQSQVKDNLSIFIKAAAARHEALDHVLDVQALLLQGGEPGQDAGDPLGKAGGRPKVEQKLGRRQALAQGDPEQVGVGRPVAQQQQGQVDEVRPEIGGLPPD